MNPIPLMIFKVIYNMQNIGTKVIKKCRLATLIGKINFKVEDYSKAPAV